jgi:YHS domain-containing protein
MTTTTDPVCGKQFERSQAVAQAEHHLHTYFFCSDECRTRFEADPEQYSASPSLPACAGCGGAISQEDIVCPHCGIPLAAG